ncbi:hypothetical protein CANCADRAFT_12960, partial [Tortispora caseinolytica NRRL Y-17796]
FEENSAAGMTSASFDLNANIDSHDSRNGLETKTARIIKRIMKKKNVEFDIARALYVRKRMELSGIGPDGIPLDPRLATLG